VTKLKKFELPNLDSIHIMNWPWGSIWQKCCTNCEWPYVKTTSYNQTMD
jgi:hypothetical protein